MKKLRGIANFLKNNLDPINETLKYPLVYAGKQDGMTTYRFNGINERIQLNVTFNTAEIWFHFNAIKKDWIFDLSHPFSMDNKGNPFCEECDSPKFNTESEFYSYFFIQDIKRVQRLNFQKDAYLLFYKDKKKEIYFCQFKREKKLYHELRKKSPMEIISIEKVVL